MLRLKPYFPASGTVADVASMAPETREAELEHYVSVVLTRAGKVAVHVSQDDEAALRETIRARLTRKLDLKVARSAWKGSLLHSTLYELWSAGDKQSEAWCERLRDHHELVARCPYCGFVRNRTFGGSRQGVDHFLPRAEWPELSIVPTNLVPSCDACNEGLKKTLALDTDGNRVFLHPYCDDFIDRVGLIARVETVDPLYVAFEPSAANLTVEEAGVVRTHFSTLHLDRRYRDRLGEELLPLIRAAVCGAIRRGAMADASDVARLLRERAEEWAGARGRASWETVVLETLAAHDIFASTILEQERRKLANAVLA